jgi:hypothetical protein
MGKKHRARTAPRPDVPTLAAPLPLARHADIHRQVLADYGRMFPDAGGTPQLTLAFFDYTQVYQPTPDGKLIVDRDAVRRTLQAAAPQRPDGLDGWEETFRWGLKRGAGMAAHLFPDDGTTVALIAGDDGVRQRMPFGTVDESVYFCAYHEVGHAIDFHLRRDAADTDRDSPEATAIGHSQECAADGFAAYAMTKRFGARGLAFMKGVLAYRIARTVEGALTPDRAHDVDHTAPVLRHAVLRCAQLLETGPDGRLRIEPMTPENMAAEVQALVARHATPQAFAAWQRERDHAQADLSARRPPRTAFGEEVLVAKTFLDHLPEPIVRLPADETAYRREVENQLALWGTKGQQRWALGQLVRQTEAELQHHSAALTKALAAGNAPALMRPLPDGPRPFTVADKARILWGYQRSLTHDPDLAPEGQDRSR